MVKGVKRLGLAIDADRLWQDLLDLGNITEVDRPYTRRAFSPLFAEGRAFLTRIMAEAGLKVRVDSAGNLIGRLEGTEPDLGVIAIGSHSDTVQGGGRFDGIAGVIAGIAVARSIAGRGLLRHSIEIVDFLCEEPSDFGLSCIGSRAMAGLLDDKMLAMTSPGGVVLSDALRDVGGKPDLISTAARRDLAAFIELHIEQGPVLEARDINIGVVSSIAGIRRIEVEFEGQAAHAGTMPMDLRKDAVFAGALSIIAVREFAEVLARESSEYFVATVGIVEVKPGGSNVVPGLCRLVIDARSSIVAMTDRFEADIDRASREAADKARVRRSSFKILSDGLPASCGVAVRAAISEAAQDLGLSSVDIASGAGHDTAFIAHLCPTGMVFIPCLRGMSHTPEEWSTREQLAAGTSVLLHTLLNLDTANTNVS